LIGIKHRSITFVVSVIAGIPLASISPEWTFIMGWGFADAGLNPYTDLGAWEKLALYAPLLIPATTIISAQLALTWQRLKLALFLSAIPLIIYGVGFYLLRSR